MSILNPSNTYKILWNCYSGNTLSMFQYANTYEVLKTVYNPLEEALNVNIVNLDEILAPYTLLVDFYAHTGDTGIHFTKESILLSDLYDVSVSGVSNGQYLSYLNGDWIPVNDSTDLSNYYNKQECDVNFLSANTSYYTQNEVDNYLLLKTDLVDFINHTGTTNAHDVGFDNLTNTAHTHNWYDITATPTTLSGYSITDAYTKTEVDNLLSANTSLWEENSSGITTKNITDVYLDKLNINQLGSASSTQNLGIDTNGFVVAGSGGGPGKWKDGLSANTITPESDEVIVVPNIEITNHGEGLTIISTGGNKFKLVVDEFGNLSTTPI